MTHCGLILADAITGEGLLLLGCFGFVLPAVFIVLAEAGVLTLVCRKPFRSMVKTSFVANAASALAGIPLYCIFLAVSESVPHELDQYFAATVRFTLARYAGYYLLSVALEFWIVWIFLRAQPPRIPTPRVAAAVILANLVSYGVICPLLYAVTAPQHTLAGLQPDTTWVRDDHTALFFIDPATGFLMQTDPRHTHTRTIVAARMTDYALSADLQTCLFLNETKLSIYFRATGVQHEVAQLEEVRRWDHTRAIARAALSPSGRHIAFTLPILKTNSAGEKVAEGHELHIYDVQTMRTSAIPSAIEHAYNAPMLAWTTAENVLLTRDVLEDTVVALTLAPDFKSAAAGVFQAGAMPLNPAYGTFGPFAGGQQPNFQVLADDASAKPLYATVWSILASQFVAVSRYEPWPDGRSDTIRLDTTRGVRGLTRDRAFADIAVIPDSTLCVLEDETYATLYVIDAETRTLGRLGPGRKMVLLTPKYQPAKYFTVEKGK